MTNKFDLKNYEPGSANAVLLEERMRCAGVWPGNGILATKMLRRQLRILRLGDMADMVAYGSVVNKKDEEQVRLRYWRDRAAKLCQDKDIYDWPNSELTLDEIKARLAAAGIDPKMIEDELEQTIERGKKRRERNRERKERQEKRWLKELKTKQMLDIKYNMLLSKVEKEHGLKLEHVCMSFSPCKIRIIWIPKVMLDGIWTESYFSVYSEYNEAEYSTAYPLAINAILQVSAIGSEMVGALQKSGHHLKIVDDTLTVMSGTRYYRGHFFRPLHYEDYEPEVIVTEGEDVELAARLHEQVKAAKLRLHAYG